MASGQLVATLAKIIACCLAACCHNASVKTLALKQHAVKKQHAIILAKIINKITLAKVTINFGWKPKFITLAKIIITLAKVIYFG